MKSRNGDDQLVEIPKKHVLAYDIVVFDNESLVRWTFRTKKRGIVFGLARRAGIPTEAANARSPGGAPLVSNALPSFPVLKSLAGEPCRENESNPGIYHKDYDTGIFDVSC
jgi:hypothetical protein